jgi:hypothetical protein
MERTEGRGCRHGIFSVLLYLVFEFCASPILSIC